MGTALVFVQDHPGKLNHAKLEKKKPKGKGGKGAKTTEVVEVYKGGFTPSIHIRTAKAPCQMVDIKWKMGKSTNNQKVESPMYIENTNIWDKFLIYFCFLLLKSF